MIPQEVALLVRHVEGRTEQSRSRRGHPVPVLFRHRVQVPIRIVSIAPPKWQHLPSPPLPDGPFLT